MQIDGSIWGECLWQISSTPPLVKFLSSSEFSFFILLCHLKQNEAVYDSIWGKVMEGVCFRCKQNNRFLAWHMNNNSNEITIWSDQGWWGGCWKPDTEWDSLPRPWRNGCLPWAEILNSPNLQRWCPENILLIYLSYVIFIPFLAFNLVLALWSLELALRIDEWWALEISWHTRGRDHPEYYP